jgi:hypothetical protein
VKLFGCPGWSVTEAGVTVTEIAGRGGGAVGGGVLEGGGSPAEEGECALEVDGTEAHPPARKADRQSTPIAMGARASARTPGSEFKVQILQFFP